MADSQRICSVDGCGKEVAIREFCRACYHRLRRRGELSLLPAYDATCSIDGCDKDSHKKGFCNAHYKRLWKYGSPTGRPAKANGKVQGPCKVIGCGKVTQSPNTQGYCEGHFKRFRKYGDPLAGQALAGAPQEWLKDHSEYDGDDCLIWPFGRDRNGYGSVSWEGKSTSANHIMCRLAHGDPKGDKNQAAHACHNGHLGCVNPRHLEWQSRDENLREKPRKTFGETHWPARLTEKDVIEMRRLYPETTVKELAEKHDVSYATAYCVVHRRTWKHI